ncbi:sugar ABC transporter substrate-binding protein [Streptomyces sp. V4-01]|uniref:Sugar ABC transporter substrate-binding protein n=1 Tax=Actinacidiphila polyblastidii TaxID=3110430 RepID=A0ABU7P3I8_9ACTN|nr:sugar ABC transporter substrate-binding protein [Streptomyces sp. V4-01]
MTRTAGRRRSRSWAAVAGTAALLALVSACGNSSSGGGAGSVEGSKITLSVQAGLVPQFKKYVAAYEAAYPNRKITVESLPDDATQYVQQLVTERLGNKLPDVLMNVDYAANQLADGNITLDVADRLKEGKLGLKGSSFLPQFLGQYRPVSHPEEITGLPVSADSTTLFYNKTIFQKAGVTELPKATWTWDDLYRVGAEIQQKTGGRYAGLFPPLGIGDQAAVYNPVIRAYGGFVYDPKTKKSGIGEPAAVKAWTQLLKAYGTAAPKYSANSAGLPKFEQGQTAMAFSVRATVPTQKETLKDDWDVQTMPKIDGNPTVGGGSYGLSISRASNHQDAAWAFLAWFYSQDGGMKLAQATGQVVPPTLEGVDNGAWRQLPAPPQNEAAFAQDAKDAYLPPALPGAAQKALTDSVIKAVQQVELQHKSVASAFGDAEKAVNQALQSAK